MRTFQARDIVVGLCLVVASVAVTATLSLSSERVQTEDRNGDGRPDVWRVYNARGELIRVAIDTNFDGRSDVQEYYAAGGLVRRESDRDFNDRVDVVEEFDPTTHEPVRAIVDVDNDGTADLLVLFQSGRPVYAKAARPAPRDLMPRHDPAPSQSEVSRRAGDDPIVPLTDPFSTDTVIGMTRTTPGSDVCVGLSTAGGLPASHCDAVDPIPSSAPLATLQGTSHTRTALLPRSPRGPPPTLS